MMNDYGPVRRDVDVQLDGVGTEPQRLLEGGERVLEETERSPAVADPFYIPAWGRHDGHLSEGLKSCPRPTLTAAGPTRLPNRVHD